jgi:hypothetical protein
MFDPLLVIGPLETWGESAGKRGDDAFIPRIRDNFAGIRVERRTNDAVRRPGPGASPSRAGSALGGDTPKPYSIPDSALCL